MVTKDELQQQVLLLQKENAELRKAGGSFFKRMPEKTETYSMIRDGFIPFLQPNMKANVRKLNREPKITVVEGDNLAYLTACQTLLKDKVDVLYLDPPYNTQKDVYTYTDRYGTRMDKHSSWLSFMERRLMLTKPLLRDTGVVLCAIGVEELSRLRLLMDSVFGEENFIAQITWTGSVLNNASYVSTSSDYMLIYASNLKHLKTVSPKWRTDKLHAVTIIDKAAKIWESCGGDVRKATKELRKYYSTDEAGKIFNAEPGLKMYNNFDSEGKVYRSSDLSSPSGKGGQYMVKNPSTNEYVTIPVRGWVHSEETFWQKVEQGEILWNGTGVPAYKRLLEDNLSVVMRDVINKDREDANRSLARQIGRNKFSYPKDHTVLAEWFNYVTPASRLENEKDPVVVLDIFAGSGSTGLAVSSLNADDGGKRECVLVTTAESNICETVTIPRLKAWLTGEWFDRSSQPVMPGQVNAYKIAFTSQEKDELAKHRVTVPYCEVVQETVNQLKSENLIF